MTAGFTSFQFHSSVELYLVEDGEVDVWVGHKYKRLRCGEMAVILSFEAHQYAPVGEADITYLVAPASVCAELGGKRMDSPFVSDAELFENVRRCCAAALRRSNSMLTDGCIRAAFGLLMEKLDFVGREEDDEPGGLTPVLLYLHDNFKNDLSLTSVASVFGYNPGYLSRCFGKTLGIGFNNYLTMLRLREAAMLLSKGYQADYCAFESGFNSLRTFYRAFRREFECTPKEYAVNAADGGTGI